MLKQNERFLLDKLADMLKQELQKDTPDSDMIATIERVAAALRTQLRRSGPKKKKPRKTGA